MFNLLSLYVLIAYVNAFYTKTDLMQKVQTVTVRGTVKIKHMQHTLEPPLKYLYVKIMAIFDI